ncbi:protein containing DUF820 [Candidatus Magnetomorum sp. HK-1]|nr:protein containing DUF820 [Candidatus Magnetomorum sp. HK-1]
MELLSLDSNYSKEYCFPLNIYSRDKYKQNDFFELDHSNFEPELEESIQSEDGKFVSEEEYWETYYEHPDFKYEWKNGILEEREMPEVGDYKLKTFLETLISEYLKFNPIGLFSVSEIGFKMNFEDGSSIRIPDFALILNSNSNHPESTDKSYTGIFDLCVEYLSDSKKKYVDKDTKIKKKEYGEAGVREYFIIDNKKKHTAFYTLDDNHKNTYKKIKPIDGIIHSKVLPGFKFRIDDLYSQPDLKDLIDDDVYKSYVLLDYQKQCQNTMLEKIAREQAEKEKEKALNKANSEKIAREQAEKEKEKALNKANSEKIAREQAEKEKEKALNKADSERIAREQAEKEIERLLKILKSSK